MAENQYCTQISQIKAKTWKHSGSRLEKYLTANIMSNKNHPWSIKLQNTSADTAGRVWGI